MRWQGHPPEGVAAGLGGGQQPLGQFIIVAEQAGEILAQGDDDSAGQDVTDFHGDLELTHTVAQDAEGKSAGASLSKTSRATKHTGAVEDGAARSVDREQEAVVVDVPVHREGVGR